MGINLLGQPKAVTGMIFVIILASLSFPASPQPSPSGSNHPDRIKLHFVPPPPPNQGSPRGRRKGGASRGCQKDESEVPTALVPEKVGAEKGKGFVWGLTTVEEPTFWFFIPEPLSAQVTFEFVVQDETDGYVYQKTLTMLRTDSGIVSFVITPSAKPLEVDKPYYWTLSINYCDPDKPSNSVVVQGTVQRVALAPSLQSQLEAATPQERVALYAAHGIWHEALTTLAELRRIQPNSPNLMEAWTELLQQVGLEELAAKPVLECCTSEN